MLQIRQEAGEQGDAGWINVSEQRDLFVRVRTLGRVLVRWGRGFANPDVETYGQLLGRITGSFIACLVFQGPADDVLAGLHGTQWTN